MKTDVLVIVAHHEEVEAEFPNTVAALTCAGCRVLVYCAVGGWNWSYIRSRGPRGREITLEEAMKAAEVLGCEKIVRDYPIACLDTHAEEIKREIAEFMLARSPEIVLMHWPNDRHNDHRDVAELGRRAVEAATALSDRDWRNWKTPRELYAFQTGVAQAYDFFPDVLVRCNDETMSMADRAVACFDPALSEGWKKRFHAKAEYWGDLAGTPCEGLKFLGPALPLEGFLLKKILGDRLISAPFHR